MDFMSELTPKTAEELKQLRKRKNLVVLGLIFGMVVLFYIITVVRIGMK